MSEAPGRVRLDKWLWAARFFKTRSLAKRAIESGKVHYDGRRVKVSKEVAPGATLTIRQGRDEISVVILDLSDKRGPAPQARGLYEETSESIAARERRAAERAASGSTPPPHRPGKRDRRLIHRFTAGQS